jgi:hypothetical protein
MSALRPTHKMEDHVSVFMSPGDKMAQLYPQAPSSLFVAFNDLQNYGEGILICLHAGNPSVSHLKIRDYCYIVTSALFLSCRTLIYVLLFNEHAKSEVREKDHFLSVLNLHPCTFTLFAFILDHDRTAS